MPTFLEEILRRRMERVLEEAGREAQRVPRSLPAGPPENPAKKIRKRGGFLVAEIKRASPSKGPIAPDADAAARAEAYAEGGADAISVLTEPDFFGGSREDLRAVARRVPLPILCKDFVVHPAQIAWAQEDGASWVLLIARALGADLGRFVREALEMGLEPLVEVRSEAEMASALDSGARVLGINARDLDTFAVDLAVVERLAPLCPADRACIAESGISGPGDLRRLRDAGAHGFLIGESLMRAPDPRLLLRQYRDALLDRSTA